MDIVKYPQTPRLVNRFTLGADPEFTFHDLKNRYIYAEGLGMTTMHAFGCDMSGRQAEIRAYPSRFALEVVASVVDSLRWMAHVHGNQVLPLRWIATAFNGKDGCGGHIHFGRRRPNREQEVKKLDATLNTLLNLGVVDKLGFVNRQVANPNQHYGQYGDIRPQAHGFEYRTPPTQMASPWLLYFTLVVNKLCMYEELDWHQTLSITNLLQKYADRDDDAAIALKALKIWGLPKESQEDFKGNWGVSTLASSVLTKVNGKHFPSVIQPETLTCEELFLYLTQGIELPKRVPNPTWPNYVLPQGFMPVQVQEHTLGHLPDVGMNLVSKNVSVTLQVGMEFAIFPGATALSKGRISRTLQEIMPCIRFYTGTDGIVICVTQEFNKSIERCKKLHKILRDTSLFPVCKAADIEKVTWSRWDNQIQITKPPLGKLLATVRGKPKVEIASAKKYVSLHDLGFKEEDVFGEEEF